MAAMVVTPGRCYRHKSSAKACRAQRVAAGWVYVRYRGSRVDRKYPIDQFVTSFESIPNY